MFPPLREGLSPATMPNEVVQQIAKAFADRLSVASIPQALALSSYVEGLIDAIRRGDIAAFIIGLQSLEATAHRLVETFNEWGHVHEKSIRQFDPAYWQALAPARREFAVLRTLNGLKNMEADTLLGSYKVHRLLCPKPETCELHEAYHRELESRGIRG